MGVDYYNCKMCGDIFADCSDHGTCEGCYATWCEGCKHSVTTFVFGGEERCDFCWHGGPKRVKKQQLLDFAVKKLKTTVEALEEEFCAQAGPEYRESRDSYYCTQCAKGECANKRCTQIDKDCDLDDPDDDDQHRGYCCAAQIKFCGASEDELCEGCTKWQAHRTVFLLLGLGRFRPKTGLAMIPKDVLRYMILPCSSKKNE